MKYPTYYDVEYIEKRMAEALEMVTAGVKRLNFWEATLEAKRGELE